MSKIDLNKSSKNELTQVKRIGPKKAERIINYRKNHGLFESKEELLEVKGFGQATFSLIEDEIEVSDIDSGTDADKDKSSESNKIYLTFDPEYYNLSKNDIYEVHLVGEMNDWNPADKTYALKKREDGIWEGSFLIEEGTEFKFLYNSDSWEEDKDIGDNGANIIV